MTAELYFDDGRPHYASRAPGGPDLRQPGAIWTKGRSHTVRQASPDSSIFFEAVVSVVGQQAGLVKLQADPLRWHHPHLPSVKGLN